jgi:AraC family transcriptional regulator
MRHPGHHVSIVRRTLFESDAIQISSFTAHPVAEACGDVECQSLNVVVLPFAGVFSKHEAPGRHVVGTPSHAVFIRADTPYRIGFPGAIGDRAIILRFDDTLVPDEFGCRRGGETLGSHGLLPADALIRSSLLRRHLTDPDADRFEIETLGLELLSRCLRALRGETLQRQPVVRLRRMLAVERVKEAVAAAPADAWSVARLATIANLLPFHLCHVFRRLVGTSIYEYVLRERLAQALNAVLDATDDITAIALDAGFASHSHFTARFRRFFGCTPSALRRAMGAGQVGELRKIMTARASDKA